MSQNLQKYDNYHLQDIVPKQVQMYRVRLKMTQRVKCDYMVTPGDFCATFYTLV